MCAKVLKAKGRFTVGMVGKIISKYNDIYTNQPLYKVQFSDRKNPMGVEFFYDNEIEKEDK